MSCPVHSTVPSLRITFQSSNGKQLLEKSRTKECAVKICHLFGRLTRLDHDQQKNIIHLKEREHSKNVHILIQIYVIHNVLIRVKMSLGPKFP